MVRGDEDEDYYNPCLSSYLTFCFLQIGIGGDDDDHRGGGGANVGS